VSKQRSSGYVIGSKAVPTLLVLIALGFLIVCPYAVAEDPDLVEIQILGINDLHGYISQVRTADGRPVGGAAFLATYLRERESMNPNTIKVHAGDVIGASPPVSSLFQDEPAIEVLQFMGFDVGVPGNHEFDKGFAELLRLQRGGRHEVTGYFPGSGFPLVLANVVDSRTRDPVLHPYVIKTVAGVPVGFIGVVTTETPSIVANSGIKGLVFLDPVECVDRYVAELRAKGIETIILLAHEGGWHGRDGEIAGPIGTIAEGVDDAVDVVFSGHSHTRINGRVDGKLVVQAYSKATAFADVDLVIDRSTLDVVSATAEIVTVWADVKAPDTRVAGLVGRYEDKVRPLVEKPVAVSAIEITQKKSRAGESALGNLVADSQRWAAETQIAFMNSGGIRADIPEGIVTWGNLYETQPFGNALVRMQMTGDQIYYLLNQQWQLSENGLRVRFLQVSGLRYTWDDSRPVGSKVVRVCLSNGEPVRKDKHYSVVANSFLASGGDSFTVFTEVLDQEYLMGDVEALAAYLESLPGPVSAEIEGRISVID